MSKGLQAQLKPLDIKPSLSVVNDINLQDWYLGFTGGIEDMNNEWGVRLGFNFRPFRKYVQIQESDFIIRQYREKKYYLYLDIDKRFIHFPIGSADVQFFAGIRPGYLFGDYSGTRNDATPYWLLAPMGGVSAKFGESFYLKAAYLHISDRLINVSDGRISLTALFILNHD
jgi:hypothetical protein